MACLLSTNTPERIKYEYFREKIGEVSDDLQELLVPIVIDYQIAMP